LYNNACNNPFLISLNNFSTITAKIIAIRAARPAKMAELKVLEEIVKKW
jgi:hypothetical protein